MTAPQLDGQHRATSFHARLLVLLAEHAPVPARHLLDDQLTVECTCGNPLYTGHLIRLLTNLAADPADAAGVPMSPLPGHTTACASSTAPLAVAVPGPNTPAGQGNPSREGVSHA